MSVRTTADDCRDNAKEHLNKALREVLDPSTWGHSEYKEEYIDKLQEAYWLIIKAKKIF